MDESLFGGCRFFDVFVQAKFKDFICRTSEEKFPSLVKLFYSNINYKDGIISYEVCEQDIYLSLKKFVKIYYLPCTNSLYKSGDLDNSEKFNSNVGYQYLISNPKFYLPFPLTTSYVCPSICIIYYVATPILIPRKINLGLVSKTN